MKKLLLLLFLLAIFKIEAQQNQSIEKVDIRGRNPQTGKEIKTAEVNTDTQSAADLKKLADELVNAFAIDNVTWSRTSFSDKIKMPPRDIDKPFLMTKDELVDIIAVEAKLTKVDAGNALNALYANLSTLLNNEESLQLIHFEENKNTPEASSARVADLKKLADELVNLVADEAKLTKADAGNALNAISNNLYKTLKEQNMVPPKSSTKLIVPVAINKGLIFEIDKDPSNNGLDFAVLSIKADDKDMDSDGYGDVARGIEKSDIRRGMVISKPSPSRVATNNPNTEDNTTRATGVLKNVYPPGSNTKPSRFGSFDEIDYFVWEYLGEDIPNANYIIEITKLGNNAQPQQIFIGQVAANTHKNAQTGEVISSAAKKVAKFKAGKALADVVKRNENQNQEEDGEYKWKVTETTTGISSEPSFFTISDSDPCKIDIKPMGQGRKYCTGATINLNWSGFTPSGQVTISLFDNANNTVYAVLATGIANTGSYSYTIPSSLPCDPPRSWTLIVEDAEKLCLDRSDPFIIECCNQQSDCNCGKWLTNNVTIKGHLKKEAKDQKLKINLPTNFEKKLECGDKTDLNPSMKYAFLAPNYLCNPENCAVEYHWEIINAKGSILSGNGKTFNYTFNKYGTYKIIFTPICGGKRCAPCVIYVNIDKFTSLPNEPGPIIGDLSDLPVTNPNDVYNPKTGKTWMNKNLGASQVATSPTDAAAYGDLYQWGRLTDGHEKRTSGTTTVLSSSDVPGHGNFILHPNLPGPLTWNSPQNINLWQGVNGTNNPCPSGYRIPTDGELAAERLSWTTPDAAGAFASPLKWTLAGNRSYVNGQIVNAGLRGSYWSSYTNGAMSSYMYINNGSSSPSNNYQTADGASVRCIKN